MYKADFYQIPTGIDRPLAEHIIENICVIGTPAEDSTVGLNGNLRLSMRNSQQRWLPTDSWVAGMMAHFINEANRNFYNYDLTGWSSQIQYTEYNGEGTHYSWHCDSADSKLIPGVVRKLSISLLLSSPDEYEGGELEIMYPGMRKRHVIKPILGQAIVFPSTAMHRVKRLKSGRRISLVGWYGGPPFR